MVNSLLFGLCAVFSFVTAEEISTEETPSPTAVIPAIPTVPGFADIPKDIGEIGKDIGKLEEDWRKGLEGLLGGGRLSAPSAPSATAIPAVSVTAVVPNQPKATSSRPQWGRPRTSATVAEPEPTGAVKPMWVPKIGDPFQIVLSGVLDMKTLPPLNATKGKVAAPLEPNNVEIFDIDLWENPTETVEQLHKMGKKVICYFSAGTSESWRPDFKEFRDQDQGARLPMWPGERWLDVRSRNVWTIMQKRIQLASKRGCDAIDPDNVDGFDNERGGGFRRRLTKRDAVTYLRKLSREAKKYGMSTGLKNAMDVLKSVESDIHFAVNEECAQMRECNAYNDFVTPRGSGRGKPVFHIEYVRIKRTASRGVTGVFGPGGIEISSPTMPNATSSQVRNSFCLGGTTLGQKFSTVIKQMSLDGWVMYCDGSMVTTRTVPGNTGPGPKGMPQPQPKDGKPQGRSSRSGRTRDAFVQSAVQPVVQPGEWLEKPEEWDGDNQSQFEGTDDEDIKATVMNSSLKLPDDVWDQDVGPIKDADLENPDKKHQGAGKDWISPERFVEIELEVTESENDSNSGSNGMRDSNSGVDSNGGQDSNGKQNNNGDRDSNGSRRGKKDRNDDRSRNDRSGSSGGIPSSSDLKGSRRQSD